MVVEVDVEVCVLCCVVERLECCDVEACMSDCPMKWSDARRLIVPDVRMYVVRLRYGKCIPTYSAQIHCGASMILCHPVPS